MLGGDLEILHASHCRRALHLPAGKPYLNSGNAAPNNLATQQQQTSIRLTPPSARRNNANLNNNNNNSANNNNNNNNVIFIKQKGYHASELARRSCLLTEESRIVRVRKTVVFADARGLALTQVRIMSEPSEVPPFWSQRFLSQLTAAAAGSLTSQHRHLQDYLTGAAASAADQNSWSLCFPQPARDYVEFRRRLDESNVALENVAIVNKTNDFGRHDGGRMAVGTIKVRNLDYHKEVALRYTADGWKSFKDEPCSHVQSAAAKMGGFSSYTVHDTFRFELSLPGDANSLEFCVSFRCAGSEFWDNNRGCNYTLRRNGTRQSVQPNAGGHVVAGGTPETMQKVREATAAKIGAWSEFASWEHLENSCPYW